MENICMAIAYDKYEAIIGLEVHVQLLTKSKAFSSDSTAFGAIPNSNVSVISLGHPGVLPRFNKKILEYAVKLGLAVHADIRKHNEFARKNYFYADLPKGYQITQDTTPICTGGYILLKKEDKTEKKIHLTRIHMEEDSGKSIHDQDPYNTLIDLNRAGVPLLEIVSEPEIANGDEAFSYLTEIRKLVRYLDICDGNMEEGSLRCDANISVRPKGQKKFGTKVEIKNMNSITNVKKGIEFEIFRQIEAIEKGEAIIQQTRSFDASTGTTFVMRTKEHADDYRYFPEPDLNPILVTNEYIDEIRKSMPALPYELHQKYTKQLNLSDYDATIITDNKELSDYFEKLISHTTNYKAAANLLMGPIKSYINENAISITAFPVQAKPIVELIKLIDQGKISNTIAIQKIFPLLIAQPEKSPLDIAVENQWIQDSNQDNIATYIKQAIEKYPEKVSEYKSGKTGLIGLFMGEVMKLSKGKADPKITNQLLKEYLDKQ